MSKAKKKTTKKSNGKKGTVEVKAIKRGEYEWRVISAGGRTLDKGKSKKRVTADKTAKSKASKRTGEFKYVYKKAPVAKKGKVAKNRCARKGPISSRARKSLPANAFAVPSTRSYPLYKMGSDGKLVPSSTHATNAKARAKQQLDAKKITRSAYTSIVRKANKVLATCSKPARAQKAKARAAGRLRGRKTSCADSRRALMAAVNEAGKR
jgi:hypothetical protein